MLLDKRPSAVAGTFYPDDPTVLARTVDDLVRAVPAESRMPKAIVVPHAGYIYSGAIAASGFARLRAAAKRIERVVMIGPAHRVPVRGLAAPGARSLETPLGDVAVDNAALAGVPGVTTSPLAHAAEHSLEVELPFLQRIAPQARVIPLAAGDIDDEGVGRVLEALWGGPETVIVISTDLSHYLPYDRAKAIDAETLARVVALDADGVGHDRACGATGLRGLLWVARRKRLTARLLDARNSGDTAGDKKRVVGYAALALYEPEAH
jgi:MEMO1 family protein